MSEHSIAEDASVEAAVGCYAFVGSMKVKRGNGKRESGVEIPLFPCPLSVSPNPLTRSLSLSRNGYTSSDGGGAGRSILYSNALTPPPHPKENKRPLVP